MEAGRPVMQLKLRREPADSKAVGMSALAGTSSSEIVRVNLGCGSTPTPGWFNLDNSWTVRLAEHPILPKILRRAGILNDTQLQFARTAAEKKIVWGNAVRRIPLPDASASVVYSSHMFEHFSQAEARGFLAEVRRVLVPGGVLRLAVPDLLKLVRRYVEETKDADALVAATLLADEKPRGVFAALKRLAVGQRHHHWMYDAASLILHLETAGFCDAVEVLAGKTTIPDPGQLNLREREEDSVYVEARRP